MCAKVVVNKNAFTFGWQINDSRYKLGKHEND